MSTTPVDLTKLPPYLVRCLNGESYRNQTNPMWLVRLYTHRPPWYCGRTVGAIYREARQRRARGEAVCVDHTVPLANDLVCGLHCQENLRIVSVLYNAHKSNNVWPDMPYEQLELFGVDASPSS